MSDLSEVNTNSLLNKPLKTKEQYSRNVKKLKIKLINIEHQIDEIQKKMKAFSNTSNDKMIALKISKYCKQRRITPQMLFRCADRFKKNNIPKNSFKETLASLGIKLTQHELTRLQYLLDEDISGEISFQQYNKYLIAFGIKGEYSSDELVLKGMLDKINGNKLLDGIQGKDKKDQHRQLLNYQQFLKYCHRHLPELKDKQIAAIFNLLQRNNLIDLDEFLDYIKKKEDQKKNLDKKNKKIISSEEQTNSLKGIIKLILKNRPKDSKKLFHTLQFARVEKVANKKKGQLLQLFKQIDKKKKGSFGFQQLIQFYIEKEKQRDILYAYQLMGRKMLIDKQYPEDILNRYNGGPTYKRISLQQFKLFMLKQFDVISVDSQPTFKALARQQNDIPIKKIIEAMKLEQGQKKLIYIKPTAWKTEPKDFWKKGKFTIIFNPFLALRFCLQISEQLKKIGQVYWDDFEFGPTFQDPYGIDSIGLNNIASEQIKWATVQSLDMKQFYQSSLANAPSYQASAYCPNEIFCQTLCKLTSESDQFLWRKEKVNYNVKKVEQAHLLHLFEGIYPLIFHQFASFGIYVFRFFVKEKWAYVMTDNKIPCNAQSLPLFSYAKGMKSSWISLIEKGYAKIKGSYNNLFMANSIPQYIYELDRILPIMQQISTQNLTTADQKNNLWNHMIELQKTVKKYHKIFGLITDSAAHQLIQNKQQTGLQKNQLYQITNFIQIADQQSKNSHKSHRLTLMKIGALKNQNIWNPHWNSLEEGNKYDKFQIQIDKQLKNKDSKIALLKDSKDTTIINYKLFRSIFNQILHFRQISFENMIILRKIVEFEEKYICKYQLNSKKPNKQSLWMVAVLDKIKSPDQSIVQLILKDSKGIQVQKKYLKSTFGAYQFKINADPNQMLQIKVMNWQEGQQYVYRLTFYMFDPLHHLKQLDRQILFKYVSPYEQKFYLNINEAEQIERKFLYKNYFKAAERGGGCCG